jgi:site-specific recombinase XerD
MIENDEFLSVDELEKISIKHLTIEDAGRVDTQLIIDFLAYARNDRQNNSSTRNRKLSAIKSFYKHAYNKKHLINKNPAAALPLRQDLFLRFTDSCTSSGRLPFWDSSPAD